MTRSFFRFVMVSGLCGLAACRGAAPPAPPVAPAAPLPPLVEPAARPEPPLPRSDAEEAPAPVVPLVQDAQDAQDAPPQPPGEPLVRVGLASDQPRFELPCECASVTLTLGGERRTIRGPLTVTPAGGAVAGAGFRVQAAALRDEQQAAHLARSLGEQTGWPADAQFDAGTGFYRVRVGRFADRAAAEAARARLAGLGLGATWVVQESGTVGDAALRVEAAGRSYRVAGRWLALRPLDGANDLPASVDGAPGRFRGSLLLYLNDRGSLNVVNELPIEDYLRAVVPREMGPELYPRLEALKAQAVAARTYALRHLGEFAAEGYDLCAGPRCQVYGGRTAEHPLSDRAVEDTRGQVLLQDGVLVDALYSATCGGHTEDSERVFPWMQARYLRGVPCVEAGPAPLDGSLPAGAGYPAALADALGLGLTADGTAVAGLEARRAVYQRLRGRELVVMLERGEATTWRLPARLATFVRSRGQWLAADLALAAGDPVVALWRQGDLVALVQDAEPLRRGADPASRWQAWSRVKSDRELSDRVAERFPGFRFERFEILQRGVSGRVAKLRLVGRGGRSELVEGLAIRWTFDLPDTRFEARRVGRGGEPGWEFRGGGWGHGVGLCQTGTFMMAGRGVGYRDILAHYYRGLTLGRAVLR